MFPSFLSKFLKYDSAKLSHFFKSKVWKNVPEKTFYFWDGRRSPIENWQNYRNFDIFKRRTIIFRSAFCHYYVYGLTQNKCTKIWQPEVDYFQNGRC